MCKKMFKFRKISLLSIDKSLIFFRISLNMEISAAWLLTFLAIITVTNGRTTSSTTTSTPFSSTTEFAHNEANTTTESVKSTQSKFIDYARPFSNMKDILMQEIRTLDKDVSDAKVSVLSHCAHTIFLII